MAEPTVRAEWRGGTYDAHNRVELRREADERRCGRDRRREDDALCAEPSKQFQRGELDEAVGDDVAHERDGAARDVEGASAADRRSPLASNARRVCRTPRL